MARRRRQAERYSVVKLKAKGVYVLKYTRDGGRTWRQTSLGIEATDRNRSRAARAASELAKELFSRSGDDPTWEEFCERYESVHLPSLSQGSLETWTTTKNSINSLLSPAYLVDVDESAIDLWSSRLRRAGLSENTIESRLATLGAALSYAKKIKWIAVKPTIEKPHRARGVNRKARSRPVSGEEYERMLANVNAGLLLLEREKHQKNQLARQTPPKRRASEATVAKRHEKQEARIVAESPLWTRFIEALWLSGLRIDEACKLSWEWSADFAVDLSGRFPQYRIKVKGHKGARDQLCPMAPEFAAFLARIPEQERRGRVLGVTCTPNHAGRVVSAIGRASRIVVSSDGKTATAQDLRRSFGTRWAVRVQPAILQQLMRHRDIKTTMDFYVDIDLATLGAELWKHVPAVEVGDLMSDPTAGRMTTRIFNEP